MFQWVGASATKHDLDSSIPSTTQWKEKNEFCKRSSEHPSVPLTLHKINKTNVIFKNQVKILYAGNSLEEVIDSGWIPLQHVFWLEYTNSPKNKNLQ